METKPNYFVRTLITLLALATLAMAFASFLLADPKYQVTAGIITLLGIVVILVLSESFNKLSLGKVISLTKEVDKKSEENTSITNENTELRQELFKIVSNIQQSQVNNTFNAPPEAWMKLLGVVKASDEEGTDTEAEEIEEQSASTSDNVNQQRAASRERSRLRRYAVDAGLKKFASKLPVSDSPIIERVEFSSAFHAIDPIMDRKIVFDGYMKNGDTETFIDSRHKDFYSPMYFDRLYIMLSKINLYRQAKSNEAELLLILVDTPFIENEERYIRHNFNERLLEYFKPAMRNGLLRIENIEVTEEEAQEESSGRQRSML